jgi:hypothetical protein
MLGAPHPSVPQRGPRVPGAPHGKASVLAIVAVASAAIAVGAGAYYLLAVYAPQQKRGSAQREVTRWEERLDAARRCLLGESAAASSTREALALRELAPDPWSRGTCTQMIGQLSRGETEDTGMPEVEEAWRGLERAAGKVGAAFLAHVDPMGEPAETRKPDALPVALEELDAAHAALRAAVGLPKLPPRPAPTPPLARAELIPLRDGDQPVRAIASWTMPTMGGVIAFGSSGRELQLTLAPGAPAVVRPVGNGVLRTVPDAAWGAAGGLEQVVTGALDEAGSLAGAEAAGADKRAIKVEGRGRVFAVAGTAEDGLVVAGGESSLVLIRSRGGKLTADKPIAIEQLAFALDPAGRVLVAYNDEPDGKLHGFVARGGAPAKVLELGETQAGGACLTAKRGWISGPDSDLIVSFDVESGAVTPQTWEKHDLLGCTAGAALLQKRNTASFVVCTEQCRVAVLQGMRPSKIAALAGDEVVSVAHRDRVLGVWREKGPPRYFALDAPLTSLQLAMSDGKVIDIVAQAESGVVVVRVPAK